MISSPWLATAAAAVLVPVLVQLAAVESLMLARSAAVAPVSETAAEKPPQPAPQEEQVSQAVPELEQWRQAEQAGRWDWAPQSG